MKKTVLLHEKKNDSDYMDFTARLPGLKILTQFQKPKSQSGTR